LIYALKKFLINKKLFFKFKVNVIYNEFVIDYTKVILKFIKIKKNKAFN